MLLPAVGWAQAPVSGSVLTPTPASVNCGLTLSGQVLDHETRQPLPGATVVVFDAATGQPVPHGATQTDGFGNYHLHDLCAGAVRVKTLFVGYADEVEDLRLTRPTVINPRLHPTAVQLRSVEVRGARPVAPYTQVAAELSGRALDATAGQTLGEAVSRLAGVTVLQTGPSIYKPMIHGLHSNRVAVLNNGVRQEGQQWGQEHAPEIDPFLAQRLTVVKGAAAVRYGSDAIGGVVLMQPAPLRDSAGVGGRATLVAASNNRLGAASVTVDGNSRRLPALRWRAHGTGRRAGTTATPDYYLGNSGFAETAYAGAVGWAPVAGRWGTEVFYSHFATRLGIFAASHVGNLTDLQRAFEADRPLQPYEGFSYAIGRPYQHVRHGLLKATAWWRPAAGGRVELVAARQLDLRDEYDKHRPRNNELSALNRPELSYQNTTSTLDLTAELPARPLLGGTHHATVGLSGTYQDNTFRGRYFIPFYTNRVGGVFGIEQWSCGRWTAEIGVRLDRRDLQVERTLGAADNFAVLRNRFVVWTPAASVGAAVEAGPHLTVRATAALTRRAPAPNERYSRGVHNGQYEEGYDISLAPGAAPLAPETSRALNLTLTAHDNPRLNGELTAYVNHIDQFIYATPILPPVLTIRGPFPSFRFLSTDARFWGFDLSGTYTPAPRWTVLGKAAIVRTRDLRRQDYLIFTPADRAELAVRRELGRPPPGSGPGGSPRFYAQISGQAVARQTRLPANYELLDYRAAPAGYALLGAEMGAALRLGPCPLDVSVAGTNLLDHRYRDYLNRFRYFSDEMGRNLTVRVSTRW